MLSRVGSERLAPWIVLIGVLVPAALLFVVFIVTRSNREQIYHEYATSKAYADAQAKFEQECSRVPILEEVRQCFEHIIESAREPQCSEEDLRAKKEMAQWAFWMFIVSFFVGVMSIGVAIAGVYWVKQTWDLQLCARLEKLNEVQFFLRRA
jgi:hypothetical protein